MTSIRGIDSTANYNKKAPQAAAAVLATAMGLGAANAVKADVICGDVKFGPAQLNNWTEALHEGKMGDPNGDVPQDGFIGRFPLVVKSPQLLQHMAKYAGTDPETLAGVLQDAVAYGKFLETKNNGDWRAVRFEFTISTDNSGALPLKLEAIEVPNGEGGFGAVKFWTKPSTNGSKPAGTKAFSGIVEGNQPGMDNTNMVAVGTAGAGNGYDKLLIGPDNVFTMCLDTNLADKPPCNCN